MALIDERFLRPSPAMADWLDRQSGECRACGHLRLTIGLVGEEIMKCRAAPIPVNRGGFAFCIDARGPGWPCGPAGALFKAGDG